MKMPQLTVKTLKAALEGVPDNYKVWFANKDGGFDKVDSCDSEIKDPWDRKCFIVFCEGM